MALVLAVSAGSSTVRAPTRAEGLRFTRAYVTAYTHRDFVTACWMASHAYLQGTTRTACIKNLRKGYQPANKFWAALRREYRVTGTRLRTGNQAIFGYPFWIFRMSFVSAGFRSSLEVHLLREGKGLRYSSVASAS